MFWFILEHKETHCFFRNNKSWLVFSVSVIKNKECSFSSNKPKTSWYLLWSFCLLIFQQVGHILSFQHLLHFLQPATLDGREAEKGHKGICSSWLCNLYLYSFRFLPFLEVSINQEGFIIFCIIPCYKKVKQGNKYYFITTIYCFDEKNNTYVT